MSSFTLPIPGRSKRTGSVMYLKRKKDCAYSTLWQNFLLFSIQQIICYLYWYITIKLFAFVHMYNVVTYKGPWQSMISTTPPEVMLVEKSCIIKCVKRDRTGEEINYASASFIPKQMFFVHLQRPYGPLPCHDVIDAHTNSNQMQNLRTTTTK